MPKQKTHKGAAKRFKVTATGKVTRHTRCTATSSPRRPRSGSATCASHVEVSPRSRAPSETMLHPVGRRTPAQTDRLPVGRTCPPAAGPGRHDRIRSPTRSRAGPDRSPLDAGAETRFEPWHVSSVATSASSAARRS